MENLEVRDHQLVQALGERARIGRFHAFFEKRIFESDGPLAWMNTFGEQGGRHRVVSLLGVEKTRLPGLDYRPLDLKLRLGVVVADKEIYREGKDTVHLAVIDPASPSTETELLVELNGSTFRRVPLRLNCHGLATVPLQNLPVGDYSVFLGEKRGEPIQFAVAEYKLAPLVATLAGRRMNGDRLTAEIQLESFGTPVNGQVLLELVTRGVRKDTIEVACVEGSLRVTLSLKSEGPFALNLTLKSDPTRTATVPLSGTRAQEREAVSLGNLGRQVTASLLPGNPNCEQVRGLYLEEGSYRNSRFELERVSDTCARLTARVSASAVTVVVADPTVFQEGRPSASPRYSDLNQRALGLFEEGEFSRARQLFLQGFEEDREFRYDYAYSVARCFAALGREHEALGWLRLAVRHGFQDWQRIAQAESFVALRKRAEFNLLCNGGRLEYHFEEVVAGQEFELEIPSPLALLTVGAFVKDEPWEGWSFLVSPSELQAELKVPESLEPGEPLTVEVSSSERAGVYLVVKDSRLQCGDTPESMLASRIKACLHSEVADLSKKLEMKSFREFSGHGESLFSSYDLEMPVGSADDDLFSESLFDAVPARPMLRSGSSAGIQRGSMRKGLSQKPLLGGRSASRPALYKKASSSAASTLLTRKELAPPESPSPKVLEQEPEVLFAGLLETRDGKAAVNLNLPDNLGHYSVEATVVDGLDWEVLRATCEVKTDLYVHLEVPPFVHPKDRVMGAVVAGEVATLELWLDQQPVELDEHRGFEVKPGLYRAVVRDAEGRTREQVRRVDVPGKLRRPVKSVRMLQKGESVHLSDDVTIQSLRVIPNLKQPFKTITRVTAGYSHLCCEQTSAKMLSAMLVVLSGDDEGEGVLLAGVRRMESMEMPGGGFSSYPGRGGRDDYWGRKAVSYLNALKGFAQGSDLSPALAQALQRCEEMAEAGERAYGPCTCEQSFESALAFLQSKPSKARLGAVQYRAQVCHAVAALLKADAHHDLALQYANKVLSDLDGGRLYSTYDSVAAIIMLRELRASGMDGAGKAQTVIENGLLTGVSCQAGVCTVEVTRLLEEDWEAYDCTVPIQVNLSKHGSGERSLQVGQALNLEVTLEEGYKMGDLVWVCLPACLSRLQGGAQVKKFSIDFEGRNSVTIPLVATGRTGQGKQHFAVCVRNMFEEERVGSPGLLGVKVVSSTDR